MKKKEKITYSVICPFCKEHKLSVVLEVDQKKEGEGGSFEARCPFCDKYVQVPIGTELNLNTTVIRLV
jgi:Zn finger protein HypA/HybF involved in hydrogenase expression